MVHKEFKFKYDKATKQGSMQVGEKVFSIDLQNKEPAAPPQKLEIHKEKETKKRTAPKKSFTSRAFGSYFSSGSGSGSGAGALGYGLDLI